MMTQLSEALRVRFGITGNSGSVIGEGWGDAEPTSRWMLDVESHLSVPRPAGLGNHYLVLALAPFVLDGRITEQRLTVYVNDIPQPSRALRRPSVLIYKIDGALLASSPIMRVTFYHPDALQPSALEIWRDDRNLAFYASELLLLSESTSPQEVSVPQLPGLAAPSKIALNTLSHARMLMYFSSFGDNCELGLFQRRHGAEPMDIFRFSGISLPSLTSGLEERFETLCDPEQMFFEIVGPQGHREYILHHRRYALQSHTTIVEDSLSLSHLIEREIKRLSFGRRLLMDDLAAGRRIFVVKCNDPIQLPEARRLTALLRQFGPNTLLYVVPATDAAEPGHVDDLGDGLLCGHMDRFLDYSHADGVASDCWMRVCSNAYALWRPGPVAPESENHCVAEASDGDTIGSASIAADILEVLRDVVAHELAIETGMFTLDAELDDLPGWDSVTMAGVLLELESRFSVTFDRTKLENIRTVGDLAALVRT